MAHDVKQCMQQTTIVGIVLTVSTLRQQFGVRMATQHLKPVATEGASLGRVAVHLEIDELCYECGCCRLVERIACGDVHLLHLVWQTVDDGLQQVLITEHDGGATACSDALRCEPLGYVAGLYVLCGGRDIGQFTWRHLLFVLIEDSFSSLLKALEESALYLQQVIEADEDIGVVIKLNALVLYHLSVEGSLVAELFLGELVVEGVVDIADMAPQAQETFLEFAIMVF